jgi:hypothetical protein
MVGETVQKGKNFRKKEGRGIAGGGGRAGGRAVVWLGDLEKSLVFLAGMNII